MVIDGRIYPLIDLIFKNENSPETDLLFNYDGYYRKPSLSDYLRVLVGWLTLDFQPWPKKRWVEPVKTFKPMRIDRTEAAIASEDLDLLTLLYAAIAVDPSVYQSPKTFTATFDSCGPLDFVVQSLDYELDFNLPQTGRFDATLLIVDKPKEKLETK